MHQIHQNEGRAEELFSFWTLPPSATVSSSWHLCVLKNISKHYKALLIKTCVQYQTQCRDVTQFFHHILYIVKSMPSKKTTDYIMLSKKHLSVVFAEKLSIVCCQKNISLYLCILLLSFFFVLYRFLVFIYLFIYFSFKFIIIFITIYILEHVHLTFIRIHSHPKTFHCLFVLYVTTYYTMIIFHQTLYFFITGRQLPELIQCSSHTISWHLFIT